MLFLGPTFIHDDYIHDDQEVSFASRLHLALVIILGAVHKMRFYVRYVVYRYLACK
jgi:hypothetical protein